MLPQLKDEQDRLNGFNWEVTIIHLLLFCK